MKYKIQNASYFPKPYSLVANTCAALVFFLLICASASADQFNDQYFLQPGDPPLDLTHESGEKGGYFSGEKNSEQPGLSGNGDENNDENVLPTEQERQDEQSLLVHPPIETEEDALKELIEEGAVEIDGLLEADGVDVGGYSVIVDGDTVRRSAGRNVNIASVLKFWRGIKGKFSTSSGKNVVGKGRLTTGEYYALIASELATGDEHVDEVALSASRFEIAYRSRGKLFAFIPFSFPVRVTVTGAAADSLERVHVKLPWYRFFVRKYFSADSLAAEIDAVVLKELSALPPEVEDVQAILFTAVADFLRQKVRTISDSVLLGS